MKIDNINGVLPQKVNKKTIAEALAKSAINSLSKKERNLAQSIIDSVFQKAEDESLYRDEVGVKEIDLILGRIESLFEEQLNNFTPTEKENVKDALEDFFDKINLDEVNKIPQSFETLKKEILEELNNSLELLKNDILSFILNQKSSDEPVEEPTEEPTTEIPTIENVEQQSTDKEEPTEEQKEDSKPVEEVKDEPIVIDNTESTENQKKILEKTEQLENAIESKSSEEPTEEPPLEEQPAAEEPPLEEPKEDSEEKPVEEPPPPPPQPEEQSQTEEPKEEPEEKPKNEGDTSGITEQLEELKEFIRVQFETLTANISKSVNLTMSEGLSTVFNKKQQKKANKLETEMLEYMDNIKAEMKKITDFFVNFGENVIKFVEKNIFRIAKILAKALGIIMGPIVALFWKTIGPPIMLIALGIFLILLAITKHIDKFIPAITKFLEIIAQAIAVVIENFGRIIDLAFLIVEIIIQIVTFALEELWPFIRDQIWPFIRNDVWKFLTEEIWPFIKFFITWVMEQVYEPVVKPILVWIATVFIEFITVSIIPFIGFVLQWIMEKLIPFIEKHVAPVIIVILQIIHEFLLALKPYIKPFVDIVVGTLIELFKILKPVIIALANFLAKTFMTILAAVDKVITWFLSVVMGVLDFFFEVIPAFGSWIWEKISAFFGEAGETELSEGSHYLDRSSWTLEQYQQENDRLREDIKQLGGWNDIQEKKQELLKEVQEERDMTIEIDKGTVYDFMKVVNQMDSFLREIFGKMYTLLQRLVAFVDEKAKVIDTNVAIKDSLDTEENVDDAQETLDNLMKSGNYTVVENTEVQKLENNVTPNVDGSQEGDVSGIKDQIKKNDSEANQTLINLEQKSNVNDNEINESLKNIEQKNNDKLNAKKAKQDEEEANTRDFLRNEFKKIFDELVKPKEFTITNDISKSKKENLANIENKK